MWDIINKLKRYDWHTKHNSIFLKRRANRWGPGSRAWHASWSSVDCLAIGGSPDVWGCWVWTWWHSPPVSRSHLSSVHSPSLASTKLNTFFWKSLTVTDCQSGSYLDDIWPRTSDDVLLSLTQINCCRFLNKMFAFHMKWRLARDMEYLAGWAWSERLDGSDDVMSKTVMSVILHMTITPRAVVSVITGTNKCYHPFTQHQNLSFAESQTHYG